MRGPPSLPALRVFPSWSRTGSTSRWNKLKFLDHLPVKRCNVDRWNSSAFFFFFFLFFIRTHWTCECDIGVVSKWHTRDLTMMGGRRFFAYWHYVLYVPANSNRVPAWVSWYIGLRVCRLTRSVAPPRKPDDTPVTISIHNPSSVPILATHCDPHDNARPLHPEGNVSYQTVRIHAFLNTFMWVCVCVYTLTRRLVTCMRRGRSESNRETTRRLRRRSAVKGSSDRKCVIRMNRIFSR